MIEPGHNILKISNLGNMSFHPTVYLAALHPRLVSKNFEVCARDSICYWEAADGVCECNDQEHSRVKVTIANTN